MSKQLGFSLLELMIAFTIAGLLMAVSTPTISRLYDSMVYHGAVRDLITAIEATRYKAIIQGEAVDIVLVPQNKAVRVGVGKEWYLPESIEIVLETAKEFSHGAGTGVIRYYPDGSSSGGSINVLHDSGKSVRLRVDWLLGRLSQEPYDAV